MATLNENLTLVKGVVIENTEQCFSVEIQSDSSGGHYTIYLVKDSCDIIKLRRDLESLSLHKRFVIIFSNEEKIKSRSKDVK